MAGRELPGGCHVLRGDSGSLHHVSRLQTGLLEDWSASLLLKLILSYLRLQRSPVTNPQDRRHLLLLLSHHDALEGAG